MDNHSNLKNYHCNSLNPDIEEWEIPLLYYKVIKIKKLILITILNFKICFKYDGIKK